MISYREQSAEWIEAVERDPDSIFPLLFSALASSTQPERDELRRFFIAFVSGPRIGLQACRAIFRTLERGQRDELIAVQKHDKEFKTLTEHRMKLQECWNDLSDSNHALLARMSLAGRLREEVETKRLELERLNAELELLQSPGEI